MFQHVIDIVNINILENVNIKKKHAISITGPRIIQNLIFEKLNINKDGCLKGNDKFDITEDLVVMYILLHIFYR